MWWTLILSVVFVYPVVELIEQRFIRRAALKDLAAMREHAASGHRWDVTRGQWTTEGNDPRQEPADIDPPVAGSRPQS
jgi:hypothetical protein